MPKLVVAPKWAIEKTEDANWSGTIRADRVYQFNLTVDGGQYTMVASIGRVSKRNGKLCLYPSVIYENENFRLPDPEYNDVFYSDEIDDVKEMWVGRQSSSQHHRTKSSDPFEFELTDSKSGKTFTIRVDSTNFVGISTPSKKGTHTYYGHVTKASEDGEYIFMDALFGGGGYYVVRSIKISVSNIKGIFSYNITLADYEDGKAEAAARKAAYEARRAKQTNVTPASMLASIPETPVVDDEPSDDVEEEVEPSDDIPDDNEVNNDNVEEVSVDTDVESVSDEDDEDDDTEPESDEYSESIPEDDEEEDEVVPLGAQNVTGYSQSFADTNQVSQPTQPIQDFQ